MPELSNEAMELWGELHLAEENNLASLPTPLLHHSHPCVSPWYPTRPSFTTMYMPSTKMTSFKNKEEEAGALILKYTFPKIGVSSTYKIKKQLGGAGKMAQLVKRLPCKHKNLGSNPI